MVKARRETLAGKRRPEPDTEAVAQETLATLEEYQGDNLVRLDVRGRTPLADYMIIASGRSRLHVGAMRDRLLRRLKQLGAGRLQVEGGNQCDWVLIDGGGVWIHLFHPETRAFYNLEKLWSPDAPDESSAHLARE